MTRVLFAGLFALSACVLPVRGAASEAVSPEAVCHGPPGTCAVVVSQAPPPEAASDDDDRHDCHEVYDTGSLFSHTECAHDEDP